MKEDKRKMNSHPSTIWYGVGNGDNGIVRLKSM